MQTGSVDIDLGNESWLNDLHVIAVRVNGRQRSQRGGDELFAKSKLETVEQQELTARNIESHNTLGETIACFFSLNYYVESNVCSAGHQLHRPNYIIIANAEEVNILLRKRSSHRVRETLRTSH